MNKYRLRPYTDFMVGDHVVVPAPGKRLYRGRIEAVGFHHGFSSEFRYKVRITGMEKEGKECTPDKVHVFPKPGELRHDLDTRAENRSG